MQPVIKHGVTDNSTNKSIFPLTPVISFKEIIHLSLFSKNTSGRKMCEADESIINVVIFSTRWKYDVLPALVLCLAFVFPLVFVSRFLDFSFKRVYGEEPDNPSVNEERRERNQII